MRSQRVLRPRVRVRRPGAPAGGAAATVVSIGTIGVVRAPANGRHRRGILRRRQDSRVAERDEYGSPLSGRAACLSGLVTQPVAAYLLDIRASGINGDDRKSRSLGFRRSCQCEPMSF